MGEYFMYANLDRREFFKLTHFGGSKASGVGTGLAARGLGLLLMRSGREDRPSREALVGAWAGTRVVALGDYAQRGELELPDLGCGAFESIERTWRDISSTVLILLFDMDREEVLAHAAADDHLFVHLAELALVHRVERIGSALTDQRGDDWPARYKEARARRWTAVPAP